MSKYVSVSFFVVVSCYFLSMVVISCYICFISTLLGLQPNHQTPHKSPEKSQGPEAFRIFIPAAKRKFSESTSCVSRLWPAPDANQSHSDLTKSNL